MIHVNVRRLVSQVFEVPCQLPNTELLDFQSILENGGFLGQGLFSQNSPLFLRIGVIFKFSCIVSPESLAQIKSNQQVDT